MQYLIDKIITVAQELQQDQQTAASTGEHIAAAFVLNRQDLLPAQYRDMIEAWDYLDADWQQAVRRIKREHMHRLKG